MTTTPAAPTAVPGLARKISKVLSLKTESPDVINAMATLSAIYGDNTSSERRGLRTKVEERGTALNQEYLAAAGSVIQVLDQVQRDLDGLSQSCQSSKEAIALARDSTSTLLADTDKLHSETAANQKRGELIQRFLTQYQLDPAELAALQAPTIGDAFFTALSKVRSIHANCKVLLRTHHQRAGLEIMDAMSAHQEAAYERLCRWVQRECRNLGDQDDLEVGQLLQKASQALRERPVLFKYCAMEVATLRHNMLFQKFIGALTRGGPGGMPRPIEMHAHDPRRYLGDMLAWVHQSLASERELFTGLFGEDGRNTTEAAASLDMPRTGVLLDRVFDSICRPVKVRVEQVLMATPPLLLCFSLSQLLGFYTGLVDRLLGNTASLTQTLASCRQLASRVFREQLQAAGDKLMRYPPPPPPDLSLPHQLSEALQQLSDIVTSFEASYEASDDGSGEAEFAPVLAAVTDPWIEAVHRSAEALNTSAPTRVDVGSVDPSAQSIYVINCLSALDHTLTSHASCSGKSEQLQNMISQQLSALVTAHAGSVLIKSGLAEIAERLRLYKSGKSGGEESIVSDQALSADKVVRALQSFATLLSQPQSQPEFRSLQVPKIRAVAVSQVTALLADTYELAYDCLFDPASGYDTSVVSKADIRHTPNEIRTILGIL